MLRTTLIATTAGLTALGIAASLALAQGGMMGDRQGMAPGMMGPGTQQMAGQGMSSGMGPQMSEMQQMPGTPGQGMGPDMMGPGGMSGQGMMDPEMMRMMMNMMRAHGQMGQGMPGMIGPGMDGMGMMGGQGHVMRVTPSQHLTADDVRHFFGHWLEQQGNPRLKLGKVEQVDENTIVAEIVTVDDSLVRRFKVDRHSGEVQPDTGGQQQAQN